MKSYVLTLALISFVIAASGQSSKRDSVKQPSNKALADELDSILAQDQNGRGEIQQIAINGIKDTVAFMIMVQKMQLNDSLNQIKVEAILDKYGWLGPDEVGADGSEALFLVVQHADYTIQKKYLPMMEKAVKDKKADASSLALLEDRVAIKEGKKQTYGTQLNSDEQTGAMVVSPIEDPDNVDKRRATVGLPPMAEYCKYFNLKWDLDRYKKGLPLLKIDNSSEAK